MSQIRTSVLTSATGESAGRPNMQSAWETLLDIAKNAPPSREDDKFNNETDADKPESAEHGGTSALSSRDIAAEEVKRALESTRPDYFTEFLLKKDEEPQTTRVWYSSDAQREADRAEISRLDPNSIEFKVATERFEVGLPLHTKYDVMSMPTTEKGADGKVLTVGDLAWKNAMASWTEGVKNGTISADDDRAKLIRAFEATMVLENGMDMYTLDIGTGVNVQKALGLDFQGIIDRPKLEKAISDLMGSEAVSKDFAAHRANAMAKAPGLESVVTELKELAFSSDYAKHIQTLVNEGKGDVAKEDIHATYAALLAADPEAAKQFAQNMQINSLTMELDSLMGDPSKISEENLTQAGTDIGKMMLTLIKKGLLDLGRRGAEAEKFFQEMIGDKKTAKEFAQAMQELGAKYSQTGQLTEKDVEKVIGNGKYTSLEGSSVRAVFQDLTKQGVIGSLGGGVSLISAIYQLAGNGGKLANTEEGRLAIAKDFVGFLGAGKHFADLANNIIGQHNKDVKAYNEYLDNHADPLQEVSDLKRTPAKPLIGLDKTLDELLRAPDPTRIGGSGATPIDRLIESFTDELNIVTANSDSGARLRELYQQVTPEDQARLVKGMEDGYQMRPGLKDGDGNPAKGWHKGASAALLVMSVGADTFVGAADIALGALSIQKGTASGDNVTVAKGALQVAAGGFGVVGGVASSLALTQGLSFVKALAGPSFFISAVLSLVTLIPDIINDIKRTNEIKDYREGKRDLFTQFDKDGILTEDGLDKYRFLDAYMENYGQRDAPGDQSILDYRRDEVAGFMDYWHGERGDKARERGQFTSGFGLSDDHADYGGDGDNLDTRMDRLG